METLSIYLHSLLPVTTLSPCLYLRVMHPPSVPADHHINTHLLLLYLHTNRLFRYHSCCEQFRTSAPRTFSPDSRTPLRQQRPRYVCLFWRLHRVFFATLSQTACPSAIMVSSGESFCCHGYFQTATSNLKILLRDPLRAASKPINGIVRACPTSHILHRTSVSRPFLTHSESSRATARRTICLYYYHTLKPVFKTFFFFRFLYGSCYLYHTPGILFLQVFFHKKC